MVNKAASRIRFMSDGSLKTEEGWHLFGGPALTPEAARAGADGLRVLLHYYGKPTEDITGDTKRMSAVLRDVTESYQVCRLNAFVYSGDGANKVLVLRWVH